MTPGARVAAAITVLDQIIAGTAAELALTAWARSSRFAGSKDRAAIRDHVFDVLRAKRSLGDGDGRALMVRLALREGWDIPALFSGEGHAPAQVADTELTPLPAMSQAATHDLPDWLWPLWQASLGDQASAAAHALQGRAPVFLRVNTRRSSRNAVAAILANDGIVTVPHPDIASCLTVTANPRRIKSAAAYSEGLVELQDASSQWAVAQVPVRDGARLLDYCAGGGGKALAFADLTRAQVWAHDIAPQRMRDLAPRADRAGVDVRQIATADLPAAGLFDVVFCDAPCSGAGTWRRTPDAKWRLTADRLDQLTRLQDDVLHQGAALVAPEGVLAYATCSVLQAENAARVAAFLRAHPEWALLHQSQRLPADHGDGFFLAVLQRAAAT